MDEFGTMISSLERGALEPEQQQQWNRMVGAVPPDKFGQTVTDAIRQVDPRQYEAHLRSADTGLNAIGNLSRDQQVGLAQTLIGELAKVGLNSQAVSQESGVSNLDPRSIGVADLIRLLAWIHVNHSEILGRVAARYQDQPNTLAHLLGGQTLLMIASNLGARRPAGEAK